MDIELKNQIEAILFSCGRKIEADEVAKLVSHGTAPVKKMLSNIKKDYDGA